jgi:hydroxymethylglutaryl-CoA lyase
MEQVHICEVGPRDGLQNAHHLMPTEAKKAWIRALAAAGLKEIEVGSFVPPKLIPAMADTGEIVRYSVGIRISKSLRSLPTERLQRALEAERTRSPSRSRRPQAQRVERAHDARADDRGSAQVRRASTPRRRDRRCGSTAFGCTMQGEVPEDDVVRIAAALAEFCDCVALADTVGYANRHRSEGCSRKSESKSGRS